MNFGIGELLVIIIIGGPATAYFVQRFRRRPQELEPVPDGRSAVQVTTGFIPLVFIQLLVCPVIEIDGRRHRRYWGTTTISVEPGQHRVAIFHRWFMFSRCHYSDIEVDVPAGKTVRIEWHTPILVFKPGQISCLGTT